MPTPKTQKISGIGRIVNNELAPFSRQLASMLRAGMSLVISLMTIEEQMDNKSFKVVLGSVRETVEGGGAFSDGLAKWPKIFNELFVNIVRSGEVVIASQYEMLSSLGLLTENEIDLALYAGLAAALALLLGALYAFLFLFEGATMLDNRSLLLLQSHVPCRAKHRLPRPSMRLSGNSTTSPTSWS